MSTSLADQIRALFKQLAEQVTVSTPAAQVNMLTCWRKTFFGSPADDMRFYEAMAISQASVYRLQRQVNASGLDQQAKTEASRVIKGLIECTQPETFSVGAQNFRGHVADDRLGSLGILASVLRREFPEPELDKAVLDELIEEVKGLQASIKDAPIEPGVRNLLVHQLSVLLWTLEQARLAGYRGIQEATARAAVSLQELPADSQSDITNSVPTFRTRTAKVLTHIWTAFRIAGDLDKGAAALEHATNIGTDLVDGVLDSL
jgi:hypothetical protein